MKNLIIILTIIILTGEGLFWYFYQQDLSSPIIPISQQPIIKETNEDSPPLETPDSDTNLADIILKSQQITLINGTSFELQVAEGFKISVAAEGMKRLRFMALSPDNRLFITDMHELGDNTKGKIYILNNFDKDIHRFKSVNIYLSDLRNPNSIAFYKDKDGKHWLYIALTDKLIRYQYTEGENTPTSIPQTIATFPAYGLNYKYGGWHLTRTIAIHNDKLYISVGSSCNACEEKEEEKIRASILEMNMDGSNQKIYANGLRNAVGIKWVNDKLFATEMGSDHLGNDKPADKLYQIKEKTNYGWPYCYEDKGIVNDDITQIWQKKNINCEDIPISYTAFDAHSAPLGLEYFDQASTVPELKNSFLVALHGSGNPKIGTGYNILRVHEGAKAQEFISGFLQNGKRVGRPVDILQIDGKSFFFSDDYAGVVYYVSKK